MLAEKGITPIEHHLNLRARDQQSPDYLKLNPGGYVPTLVHDGRPIRESAVICEYLEEVFPEPTLSPRNTVPVVVRDYPVFLPIIAVIGGVKNRASGLAAWAAQSAWKAVSALAGR